MHACVQMLGAIPRTGAEPGVRASALEANMLGACDAGSPGARCRAELVAVTGAHAVAVPASGSSREPLGGGAIAGVAAAATLLLVAAAALFAYLRRRRSSSGASAKTSSTVRPPPSVRWGLDCFLSDRMECS